MGFLFVFLNLLMIFSSHLAAYRFFKNARLAEHLINTFLLYITQVIFSIIFLGALVKNLDILYLILLNSTISLAVIFVSRKSLKPSITVSYKKFSGFLKYIVKSKDYFLYILLFLFALQVTATLVKIYYLPPHVGDVFSYHLHPVVEWFQQGEILSYTDTPVWRVNENPLGTKPVHLWFAVFLKDITWIEIPQFLFGILLSLVSYTLMLKLNIRKNSALRYAVLIYFIPAVLLQSRTCQDHLILAACTFMAVLYLINVIWEERYNYILLLFAVLGFLFGIKTHSTLVIFVLWAAVLLSRGFNGAQVAAFIKKNRSRLALGTGIFMGYACYFIISNMTLYEKLWTKYSGRFSITILIPLVLAVVLYVLLRRIVKKFKIPGYFKMGMASPTNYCMGSGKSHREEKIYQKSKVSEGINKIRPKLPTMTVALVLLCLTVVVIKYRHFLRPFFLGHRSPVMITNRSFAREYPALNTSLIKNLLAFPFRIKDIGLYTAYTPDLLEKSGFGVQFFAFGLISYILLVPLCVFKKAYRNSIMGFLLVFSLLLLLIYFTVYFSWANYRSFIFFGVIGIISWAFLLEKLAIPTYFLKYIDVLLVLMILFNGMTCFFEGNMSARRWKILFTINNPAERTSIKYSSLIWLTKNKESWEFIDQYISPEQAIGYSGGEAGWTFPYFDNRMKRRIYFLKSLPGFKVEKREKKGVIYNMLKFTPDFKASLKQRGIRFLHLSKRDTPQKQKIFISEGSADVYKVTDELYYFKW
jgi:hypothetical protein